MITQRIVLESMESLFVDCNHPTTLRYLIEKISFWHASPKIRQSILNSLDDLFSFGYEDLRVVSNLQVIIPTLAQVFTLEKMLECVEPGYVINQLVRGASVTDSSRADGYYIESITNARVVGLLNLFLETFIDVGTNAQQAYLQKCIIDNMKEAAMFGNWPVFQQLALFTAPNEKAERCIDNCSQFCYSEQRQHWINRHWKD